MKSKIGSEGTAVRERLLDAAVRLFAEQGVAGTAVAEIAAAAGVTSAMVHYYFKTKDQLLDAVVEGRLVGRFIAYIGTEMVEGGDDPFALTCNLVAKIIEASDQMPWLAPLWVREVASEGGALREKLIRRVDMAKQARYRACIAAGQKRGEVNPDVQPQLMFLAIMGLTMLPLSVIHSWEKFPPRHRLLCAIAAD
jgi:AcrR family transcriptional regulator